MDSVRLIIFAGLLSFVFASAYATEAIPGVFGLDVSSPISQSVSETSWRCLREHGNYTFAVIQGYSGGFGINSFLSTAVSRAWAGGMKVVDVYAFMCPRCSGNGVGGVQALVNYLKSRSVRHDMIWMDVEQCSGCWESDLASNCAWIKSLANEYKRLGARVGIYSSPYEWGATVGSCSGLESLPLWYAHYDGNPSFSDWDSNRFGGWARPTIKQFADSADNSCGISIDRNWHP